MYYAFSNGIKVIYFVVYHKLIAHIEVYIHTKKIQNNNVNKKEFFFFATVDFDYQNRVLT